MLKYLNLSIMQNIPVNIKGLWMFTGIIKTIRPAIKTVAEKEQS